jgi:pyruvate formate lyase activating enzyme
VAIPATVGSGLSNGRSVCEACGACVEVCPTGAREIAGREVSVEEVMLAVLRDRVFYEESGGGVTLSGGEPMQQAAFAAALLDACQASGLHSAIDTCGQVDSSDLLSVAPRADLVLFDLKCLDSDTHRAATGSPNRRILENLRQLATGSTPIWLRVPLVPGVNDDDRELAAMVEFAAGLESVEQVHVLPYHRLGRDRRRRLGLPLLDPDPGTTPADRIDVARSMFERAGMVTQVGG